MLGLHWADFLVILAYMAFMIGIGLRAYAAVRTQGDYFMGGRRFGKAMMIMFAFGTGTHADTAVGVAAKSYSVGLAGIWYQWQQMLTTPFYWLLAPVFRRARCVTTADFFERRYGTGFATFYALYAVFMNVGFNGVMLYGSGRLIEALSGHALSLPWAMALMIVCVTIYGLAGGLIAAVWTDFFQGILTILMSFLLVPFMWHAVGGREGLRGSLPNLETLMSLHVPGEIGLFWIVMNAINSLVGLVAQPHIMANTAAGRTEMEGRVGLVGGILIKRLCTLPWALVGVLGLAVYGESSLHGDHVFGRAIRDFLPVGVVGLMLSCVMASAMSTSSVLMISSSALLTRNLYARLVCPTADEKRMVWLARVTSAVFVAVSVSLALAFRSMPEAMRYLWKTAPLIGISFFLGLWWRRANRYGAWASFLCALGALLVGQFPLGFRGDARLPHLMALYLVSGFLGGVLVSLVTPPESERRLDHFYLTVNTPVGQEAVLERAGVEMILK